MGGITLQGVADQLVTSAGRRKSRSCSSCGTEARAFSTARHIQLGMEDARLVVIDAGDHLAPGPDDGGPAPGLAAVLVGPALGRSQDETAGLDGPGPQKRLPVGLTGRAR